jgi:hypothetical protein
MPAIGAAAGDRAGAVAGDGAGAVFEAVRERFTKILPRIAGSDLREARAAAASASAEGEVFPRYIDGNA